jgi:two-component system, cell cycle response regulator DivK
VNVPAPAPAPAAPSRPRLVLIVEDHALNLKLLQDLLEAQGYRTLQTGDGLEALNLARQNLPDLILMDIQLPVMDGYEAPAPSRPILC